MAALTLQSAYTMDALGQENPALSGLEFFTDRQAATIEALAEQFWPTTDDSPGARDAGVLYYIDHALAGPYSRHQSIYRAGLSRLDQRADSEQGSAFRDLDNEQQNALVSAIMESEEEDTGADPAAGAEGNPPSADASSAPTAATPVLGDPTDDVQPVVAGLADPEIASLMGFLDIARIHTMEGLFADPIYGGNRDFAGWRAVGYPGPYYVYTEEEQQSFEPLDKPLQSIADL